MQRMRLPGNGLAALVFLLGCQRPDFQDLASGGVGQEMSGPVVRTVYAEERSDRREWVFDTVRGRFIPSTNDNESWRDGPLIMPRDNPDGSVTGILRLYPLTLVRLSAAELGEFISAQSDVVPQRLLGACPVYSVNDAPELVPGQASPGQGQLLGARLSDHYRLIANREGWWLTSNHCWRHSDYAVTGETFGIEELGKLHYAYWNPHRPLSYGAELESLDSNAWIDFYRPSTVTEAVWNKWRTKERPLAIASWQNALSDFVQPDGGPEKTPFSAIRLSTASSWIPSVLLHEAFGLLEAQSPSSLYLGALTDAFIGPLRLRFAHQVWHQRVAMPLPYDNPGEVAGKLDAIWFEASAYLLGRAWEYNPEIILKTYGGLPDRDDVQAFKEDLWTAVVRRGLRDETADSTLPYWDPGGADPIDERWRRFKQVSLVNVRFDLLPTDRVSFEIRGSSNRPDVQLSVAAKIVKYLEDPSAPVAFSSTAEPKTLASTASQSFLDFDPEYISATRGGSYAVLLRLAELALFTGDGRVSPFPDVVANRLLIPLFLWENHIKLRPYEAEIRAARAAYAHRLAEVTQSARDPILGDTSEDRSVLTQKAKIIIAPMTEALHVWAKAIKLSQRL